jgi:hypothetical protein
MEEGAEPYRFRARLVAIHDLMDRTIDPEILAAVDVDQICAHVQRWAKRFLEEPK